MRDPVCEVVKRLCTKLDSLLEQGGLQERTVSSDRDERLQTHLVINAGRAYNDAAQRAGAAVDEAGVGVRVEAGVCAGEVAEGGFAGDGLRRAEADVGDLGR